MVGIPKLIKKYYHVLKNNTFAKGVALLSGGTIAAQILNAAVSPILTRIYSPEAFGLFGLFIAALVFALGVGAFKYELAISIPKSWEDAACLTALCIFIHFTVALGLVTLVWASLSTPRLFFLNPLGNYGWLFPFTYFAGGAYQVLTYWMLREKNYGEIARTRIIQAVGQSALQIGIGIWTIGSIGLIIGGFWGRAGGSIRLARHVIKRHKDALRGISKEKVRQLAFQHRNFPIMTAPASMLHSFGFAIPIFGIASIYGKTEAGWFAIQDRVLVIPLAFFSLSVAKVFFGEISQVARNTPEKLRPLYFKTLKGLTMIGIPILLPIALFGPVIFTLVFGSEWKEAGVYAQIMIVACLIRFIVGPVYQVIIVLQKQKLMLIADAIGVAIILIGFVTVYKFDLSPRHAVGFYSMGITITYVLLLLFSWDTINKFKHSIA